MEYDLVFEGGGAKGMVFVGAMQEFEARGYKIGRLLGTSAGAITATFLAAGYSSTEMLAALQEQVDHQSVFTTFMGIPQSFDNRTIQESILYSLFESVDVPFVSERFEHRFDELIIERLMALPTFRHLFSFLERGGWYAADSFLSWIERKLNSGEYNGRPRQFGSLTLGEMNVLTGKDLSLIAADTTHGRMLVLNHRTAPDCPVIWAVRMSMSIPLLWQEVIWQPEWGSYLGHDMSGHVVVDGGLLSNFPIALFISNAPPVKEVMGESVARDRILGMLIDENETLADDLVDSESATAAQPSGLSSLLIVKRIQRLMDTALHANDMLYADRLEKMVLRLPAKGYGTTEFNMTDARREALVTAGRRHAREYFLQNTSMVLSAADKELTEDESQQIDKIATRMLR